MWEYAELFDVAAGNSEEPNLLDDLYRNIPTAIRVGQMGYRTRTTVAGPRLEAEVFPIFGRAKEGALRKAKENRTREAQEKANMRRACERLVQLIDGNFGEKDVHLTLTYRGEAPSFERCRKDVRNFLQRMKRARKARKLEPLKFIYAIGHDEHQRIHVHMITNGGISRDEVEAIWEKGIINAMRLQPDEDGLQGIANYLFQQNAQAKKRGERKNQKMWSGSRNLKKPKVRTSDSKCSNARVRRLAADIQNEAKEEMEKIYPGYSFVKCRVSYSDVVDGAYIRCVMRKRK